MGRVQQQVLTSLANTNTNDDTVRSLAMDWPGLSESSVRSALDGLWKRGLVERRGGHGSAFVWYLTVKGREEYERQNEEWEAGAD